MTCRPAPIVALRLPEHGPEVIERQRECCAADVQQGMTITDADGMLTRLVTSVERDRASNTVRINWRGGAITRRDYDAVWIVETGPWQWCDDCDTVTRTINVGSYSNPDLACEHYEHHDPIDFDATPVTNVDPIDPF